MTYVLAYALSNRDSSTRKKCTMWCVCPLFTKHYHDYRISYGRWAKKISYTAQMRNTYKILVRGYVLFEIRQGYQVFQMGILWLCTACRLLQQIRNLCDPFQFVRHLTIDTRSHTMAASEINNNT